MNNAVVPIIAIAAVMSTFLGGLFAIRHRDKLHLIIGFSAGAVMGMVFFDLIPESFELSHDSKFVPILMAAGFVVYMCLDRAFSLHSHKDDHCENERHTGRIGASALIVHSLMDGIGIGLAFKVSPSVGLIVAAAVLAHDFSDGINTSTMIMRGGDGRRTALMWLSLDALAPAIGMLVALGLNISESGLGLLVSLFAGFFIYIGASDLIPESHHRHPVAWTTISSIFGMLFIMAAISLIGG